MSDVERCEWCNQPMLMQDNDEVKSKAILAIIHTNCQPANVYGQLDMKKQILAEVELFMNIDELSDRDSILSHIRTIFIREKPDELRRVVVVKP